MTEVTLYSTRICGFCVRAKTLLEAKGVPFVEIRVDGDDQARVALAARTGQRTVPQIFVGEVYVGGFSELVALERAGALDALLEEQGISAAG